MKTVTPGGLSLMDLPTVTRPFRVILVDDDPAILRLVARLLAQSEIDVFCCASAEEGLAAIETREWELCILDRRLPDLDGAELCRRIKADRRFDARQVILLTAQSSLDDKVSGFALGADDYITKPFQPIELVARVQAARRVIETQQQLVEMARRLEELSTRDALTGVYNRRHFGAALDTMFHHAIRYQRPLSAVLIDVDHFKEINDAFGHPAGDEVLIEVARRFAGAVRASDIVARYGGEEFVVLLPETALADALMFAEKLRAGVASAPVRIATLELPVTASFGVASLAHTGFTSAAEMIAAADQALYRAKRNGRNRVEAERRRTRRAEARLSAAY